MAARPASVDELAPTNSKMAYPHPGLAQGKTTHGGGWMKIPVFTSRSGAPSANEGYQDEASPSRIY